MFSAGGGGDLAGSDLLTCGDCNTKFPLQELVAYIQHKATNCTKQEAEVSTGAQMEDKQDNKSVEKCVGSPSITGSGQLDDEEEADRENREKLDAETNTTNCEPLSLTCSVCKQQMSSAWALMQHIQLQHGLSLASDHKLRTKAQDPFLYQKLPGPGLGPVPGVMIPPHLQAGGQFPAFQFRGFPNNFGAGRLPPIRFHPGFGEKFSGPPGYPAPPHPPPLLGGDPNISLR